MLPRDLQTKTREQPAPSELNTHRLSLQRQDPVTSEYNSRRLFCRVRQALGPALENDHNNNREGQDCSTWNEDEDVDSSKNFWMDHPIPEDCSITVGSFLDPCKIEHGSKRLSRKKSPGFGKSERTQLWEALDNLGKGFESMNLTGTSLQHVAPVCSDVERMMKGAEQTHLDGLSMSRRLREIEVTKLRHQLGILKLGLEDIAQDSLLGLGLQVEEAVKRSKMRLDLLCKQVESWKMYQMKKGHRDALLRTRGILRDAKIARLRSLRNDHGAFEGQVKKSAKCDDQVVLREFRERGNREREIQRDKIRDKKLLQCEGTKTVAQQLHEFNYMYPLLIEYLGIP
ncbi:unnamed protein product [Darwinula stevensoni]|uniref:Uncharacterized protein n=1 Tax=Darwinula stevensoni TaxID=69355 RepID=A0A7R8ZZ36_9CRUS|nr:unnamed protein product [Darwinula stevensoni]CAG0881740.1 unnamed protein product [Darwinula stevensoni]